MPGSCDAIQTELDEAQAALEQVEGEAGDKIARYEELVDEVDALEQQMEEIGSQLSYVKECQFKLDNHGYSDLDALSDAIVEAYDELEELDKKAEELREELDKLQAEYEALAEEEERLSGEIDELEEEAEEVQNHIDGVEEDIAIKEDQSDLYEELDAKLESIDEHRDNEEYLEALEEFEELLSEIDSYEALQAEIERLYADLDELQGELAQIEQTIAAKQEELDGVQQQLADNDAAFDEKIEELDEVEGDITSQESKIAELEDLYEDCADMEGVNVEELESQLDTLIGEYTPLRDELMSLDFDEDIEAYRSALEEAKDAEEAYFSHNCDEKGYDGWEGGDEELPYDLPEEYEGEEYEVEEE